MPDNKLRVIAIYSGKFQPFHAGNYKVYKQLIHQFGSNNVFISTSDQLHGPEGHALSYGDKKYIISNMFSIGENKIYKVEDPFFPKEILNHFDKNSTAFVLILSDKDVPLIPDKDYFHLYVNNLKVDPLSEAGYYMPVADKNITIGKQKISMNSIGQLFSSPKINPEIKKHLFKKLYGRDDPRALDSLSSTSTKEPNVDTSKPEKTKAASDTSYSTTTPDKTDSPNSKKPKDDLSSHPTIKKVNMDTLIVNPETQNKIKVKSALKYPREKAVYKKANKLMKLSGKDRPDRTKDPIVNKAWTDRSIKRGGYGEDDEQDVKSENIEAAINELAIRTALETIRKLKNDE